MGFFDFIKGQFIDVIEWHDPTNNTIVHRFERHNNEIKMGAQLTVRESQVAIFVNEGTIADVFAPGRYELSTQNLPILTTLKSWKHGFNSPFKAEVYFINTKLFVDQKWGTTNPVILRDKEFGMVRARAFGSYAFKVADPAEFLKKIFGTNSTYTTESITSQFKSMIVSAFSDAVAEFNIPIIDLASKYDEAGVACLEKLAEKFGAMGVELSQLIIENISLPAEVEQALDKRTQMGILKPEMATYTQYQTAEAIRDAAKNEGGGFTSAAIGLGAGRTIAESFSGANNAEKTVVKVRCPKCSALCDENAKFCMECGTKIQTVKVCPSCSKELEADAKFCPECGEKL